jgi:hypothetical protein
MNNMAAPSGMTDVLNAADRIQFVLLNYSKNENHRDKALELLNQAVLAASWALIQKESFEE